MDNQPKKETSVPHNFEGWSLAVVGYTSALFVVIGAFLYVLAEISLLLSKDGFNLIGNSAVRLAQNSRMIAHYAFYPAFYVFIVIYAYGYARGYEFGGFKKY